MSQTPSVRRRLACFVYEGVLLFAVLMIAGYLFSSLTQQRHALIGRSALQIFLFVVLGIYFTWFWSRGGQTLAMKTWRIRLIATDASAVTQPRAFARYLLSWLWFAPALCAVWFSGTRSLPVVFASLAAGVVIYAAMALLHPNRQFLHDAWCQTRLVCAESPGPT